jgi:hypothetical protein
MHVLHQILPLNIFTIKIYGMIEFGCGLLNTFVWRQQSETINKPLIKGNPQFFDRQRC